MTNVPPDSARRKATALELDIPTVRAMAAPPVLNRRYPSAWVPRCAHCGAGHTHRPADLAELLRGRVVRVCPVLNRPYRLSPVHRLREAVSSGRAA